MQELVAANLITRRNCDDFAYELSADERMSLISNQALCSKWFEKTGNGLLDSIKEAFRSLDEQISFASSKANEQPSKAGAESKEQTR